MKILVTNDDGIESPGLKELSLALQDLGEVTVVAPAREQSAVGRSITFRNPVRVEERDTPVARSFALDGTPTDCVFWALHHLFRDKPDLTVSGINTGPNLGDDILYSGTVAAALEASLNGVPSIAISAGSHRDQRYDTAAKWLASHLSSSFPEIPPRTCLNVNVPSRDLSEISGHLFTRQGRTNYRQRVLEREDSWGGKYYWLTGELPEGEAVKGTDFWALGQGFVSITPLGLDLTDTQLLAQRSTT